MHAPLPHPTRLRMPPRPPMFRQHTLPQPRHLLLRSQSRRSLLHLRIPLPLRKKLRLSHGTQLLRLHHLRRSRYLLLRDQLHRSQQRLSRTVSFRPFQRLSRRSHLFRPHHLRDRPARPGRTDGTHRTGGFLLLRGHLRRSHEGLRSPLSQREQRRLSRWDELLLAHVVRGSRFLHVRRDVGGCRVDVQQPLSQRRARGLSGGDELLCVHAVQ
mmetsp:Transcript_17663/g.36177  ORF Transcript_17663/g.36177 Transcript_17663/m.36177 type:complete len:213 (+) Transcript_17663:455-1093(+)